MSTTSLFLNSGLSRGLYVSSLKAVWPEKPFGLVSKRPFASYNTASRGPPPISVIDLYGLCYRFEPAKITKDRPAQELFEDDIRLNEVMLYLNGRMNLSKDALSETFVLNIRESKVVFFARDASTRQDLQEVLQKEAGTNEIPQLWVHGKFIMAGKELANVEKVLEATAVARRSWPRTDKSYYKGFYGFQGVTLSTECNNRPMQKA